MRTAALQRYYWSISWLVHCYGNLLADFLFASRRIFVGLFNYAISSYQSRELWPPATASTSPKILSAVRSRVVWLRCLEADSVVSGFSLLLLAFSGFYSDSARLLRLLVGIRPSEYIRSSCFSFYSLLLSPSSLLFPFSPDGRRATPGRQCLA